MYIRHTLISVGNCNANILHMGIPSLLKVEMINLWKWDIEHTVYIIFIWYLCYELYTEFCFTFAESTCLSLSLELVDSLQVEQLQPGAPLLSFQQHVHAVGCIMFIPNVSLTQCNGSEIGHVYYSYDFGDGYTVKNSTEPNITHCYNESGVYDYSVNTFAVVVDSMLCFHTNLSNYITLLGKFFGSTTVLNEGTLMQVVVYITCS